MAAHRENTHNTRSLMDAGALCMAKSERLQASSIFIYLSAAGGRETLFTITQARHIRVRNMAKATNALARYGSLLLLYDSFIITMYAMGSLYLT